MLGSTLTRSAVAAAGIGLVAMLVFGIVGALPVVGRLRAVVARHDGRRTW